VTYTLTQTQALVAPLMVKIRMRCTPEYMLWMDRLVEFDFNTEEGRRAAKKSLAELYMTIGRNDGIDTGI
jgi:hypothetical protein